jgi:hypothetical protein
VLRREDFDEIEFEAAGSGDHESAARRMSQLAQIGTATESMPRSEAFLRAGEQWLLADDPAEAVNGFRLAIADGGPVFEDARVPLARALFLLGKSAEAQSLLDDLRSEEPREPRVCDLIAELLVERSDLIGALDWATTGIELCLKSRGAGTGSGQGKAVPAARQAAELASAGEADDEASELQLLLRLRYRIRLDLGLPEDEYDALLDDA